jgi:short subunit dehydrogenase-like uncharacterized protein
VKETSMHPEFMIYGANGYTGRLLARHAVETGKRPVLAGRSLDGIQPLAHELGLEFRVMSLDDRQTTADALTGMKLVLNAAGPFSKTAAAMLDACLASRTHYLDISGEISAFEALLARDGEARERGILVLPGAGFLVTATDCLAASVVSQLRDTVTLRIAMSRPESFARGSLKTMLGLIDDHVQVRRGGVVSRTPVGALEHRFDFGRGEVVCTAISGAEVISTFLTTGVANIQVFVPAKAHERILYRAGAALSGFLKSAPARVLLGALADQVENPTESPGSEQVVVVLAEDSVGRLAASRLVAPGAYAATATMALGAVDRVLRGEPQAGFSTPGKLFGPQFLLSLPGISSETLSTHCL